MEMSTNGLKKEEKNLVSLLVKEIKKKKEFNSLDNKFVEKFLEKKDLESLLGHPNIKRSRHFKRIIKEVRKILHDVYGVFNIKKEKRKELLDVLEKLVRDKDKIDEEILDVHRKILVTHRSTKERLNSYGKIYEEIFKEKPKSILDLGCGLNPCSFPWMGLDKVDYVAIELTNEDCGFVQRYFNIMKKFGLGGKSLKINLLEFDKLPKTDICFLFKVIDSLETLELNFTRRLFDKLNSTYVIVSFPTKTLSGKNLSKKRLKWFSEFIKNYEEFETENEIFYIVKTG